MNGRLWLGIIVIVSIIGAPLAVIWALNALFVLSIPYTMKTWAAVLVICGALTNKVGSR